jgi:hypothetical protein
MIGVATGFEWVRPVREGGLSWTPYPKARGRNRDKEIVLPAGIGYQSYQPPEALFRVFIDTEATEKGILEFADSYGILGTAQLVTRLTLGGGVPAGSLRDWRAAILFMREEFRLWELIRDANVRELAKSFRWAEEHGRPVVRYTPPEEVGRLLLDASNVTVTLFPEVLPHGPPGDLLRPARFRLYQSVNLHARSLIDSQLFWKRGVDRDGLIHQPANLLGFMYLQLMNGIVLEREYRQCRVCKRWLEIVPPETRVTRETCSASCRNRLYRARKEQARKMHGRGVSLKEIAGKLMTNVETVKGWVSNTKG